MHNTLVVNKCMGLCDKIISEGLNIRAHLFGQAHNEQNLVLRLFFLLAPLKEANHEQNVGETSNAT